MVKMDNWANRSEFMLCGSCMWWAEKKGTNVLAGIGRCRRNGPSMSGWPVVFDTDWCGNHKLDENYSKEGHGEDRG